MAGKCILRVTKIKNAGGVSGYARHNTRERETSHADPKKHGENSYLIGSSKADQVMSLWRDRLTQDKNPRKNAVVALDYMIHASPEALTPEAREKYLKDALKWVIERHGKENIVQAVIHRDEVTKPHLHVIVVPLHVNKKGLQKLNASLWMDGKVKLSRMQSEFHKEVGMKHGLERGLIGSKAKHQEVQRFYALANQPYKGFKITVDRPPKLGAIMDLDHWKKGQEEGLTEAVSKAVEPLIAKARLAELSKGKIVELEGHVHHIQKELSQANKHIKQYEDVIMNKPLDEIAKIRETVAKEKEQERANKQERNKDRGLTR
jgi:hypothetical protein